MKRLIVLIGLFFTSILSAEELIPQKGIEILVVNGVEVVEDREPVDLQSGLNQVVVRYSNSVGKGGGKKVFESKPFILSFEAPEKQATLIAPKIYSYEHANNTFKQSPMWVIKSDEKEVTYSQEILKSRGGFLPYRDIEELVAKHNQENGVILGSTTTLIASAQIVESNKKSVDNRVSNLEQLQAWYTKSSKEERKAFQKWIIDHN
ncbi:DUF2057 domain-containing protein [Aliivibrio sifiae]|uniref:YccT family protein n=1 Tax=Aliivibrio sifiae TaxID=566293 RepID=UPI00076AD73A